MLGPKRSASIAPNKLNPDKTKKTKVDKRSLAQKLRDSAFFIFMEQFREDNKENFPENMSIDAVAKECRYIWNSMSDCEKGFYIAKARTAEHEIAIKQQHDNLKETAMEKSSSSSSLNAQDDVEKEASC